MYPEGDPTRREYLEMQANTAEKKGEAAVEVGGEKKSDVVGGVGRKRKAAEMASKEGTEEERKGGEEDTIEVARVHKGVMRRGRKESRGVTGVGEKEAQASGKMEGEGEKKGEVATEGPKMGIETDGGVWFKDTLADPITGAAWDALFDRGMETSDEDN